MNNEDKTLVILTPGFPENEADTTCLPAQQKFIRALKNNYPLLKIIILSFEYPFTRTDYEWEQIPVIPFNAWNKTKIQKLFIWFRIWKFLKKLKKENNIVGLFSFWCTECALLGKYFAKIHALKHYIWILGQDARGDNRFIKWIHPDAEELIAMSDFLAREFYKNHAIKPRFVIPNGIEVTSYIPAVFKKDIDIIGVGSLIPLKQYDIFMRIISELAKDLPSIQVMICGKGPERNNLDVIIKELQLENNILLAGEKPHPEILQLMQRSKILLHTSSYEGFSTVCLEALYAGAQVVSFCKPMDAWIRHWHIASDKEEMLQIVQEILSDTDINYNPVLPYSIERSADAVMSLFGYNE